MTDIHQDGISPFETRRAGEQTVSIMEFARMKPEVVSLLTGNPYMLNALRDGSVSARQVDSLNGEQLRELSRLMNVSDFTHTQSGNRNFAGIVGILNPGIDEANRLRASFDATHRSLGSPEPRPTNGFNPVVPPPTPVIRTTPQTGTPER